MEPESVPELEVAYEGFRANSAAIQRVWFGQWASLIRQAFESTEIVRQRGDDVGKRAERAQSFVLMGVISSGRQALEGEAVAPGTEATLNLLEDAERRPPVPSH